MLVINLNLQYERLLNAIYNLKIFNSPSPKHQFIVCYKNNLGY